MKKILILALFFVVSGSVFGEAIKLTNTQADQLLAALLSVEAGLTAANTTIAADNINALRPKVDAFGKGQAAAFKKFGVQIGMKADDPAVLKYVAEAEANAANEISVELLRMTFSDEEITAAKIKPATLATIRLLLLPPKK